MESDEDFDAYFQAACEGGVPALASVALGDIAKARGTANVAADAGLRRESICKALFATGKTEFIVVPKVMRTLGLGLRLSAVNAH